jgi:hypothetical protein
VARWADHWDVAGAPDPVEWKGLNEVLISHCEAIGCDHHQIKRSVHVMWPADAEPSELAARAAAFASEGVDLVIFSMRGPYEVRLVEPLANALVASAS